MPKLVPTPNRAPRVSIGIPVYNGANFIESTIESLLAQTFGDFEIIISDNASTDETEAICRHFASQDQRIRYVRQDQNGGLARNYNEVLRLATGEYFKWTSHDDPCEPTLLEKAIEVLDRDPEVVLCYSKVAMIDKHGAPVGWASGAPPGRTTFDAPCPHRRYADVLMYCTYTTECFGILRRETLEATPRYRNYCLGEKVLTAELALHGKFYRIPEVLMYWRTHENQLSSVTSFSTRRLITNPNASKKFVWPFRIEPTLGYLRIIGRAPIGALEKLRCYFALMRYLLQVHKWKRVASELFRETRPWKLISRRRRKSPPQRKQKNPGAKADPIPISEGR